MFLKRFLRIKKIVYYNVDFSTKRFSQTLLNSVYQAFNHFAVRACDYCLCLTENFITSLDPDGRFRKKIFLIRHVSNVDVLDPDTEKSKKNNSIIYIGTLSNTVDFHDLLLAVKRISEKKIKDVSLDVYGSGTNIDAVQEQIRKLGCQHIVRLRGIVPRETLLRSALPRYSIGVAPYILTGKAGSPDHLFQGSDLTTKVVDYISCGLPVVSTPLYRAFSVIETGSFGYLVRTADEWERALTALLTDTDLRNRYSRNALWYARNYHPDIVLGPVLEKMLKD